MRITGIILCFIVGAVSLRAQQLPVLPMPVVVEKIVPGIFLQISSRADYIGVDASMQDRLNWHVSRITAKHTKGRTLRMLLLQKNTVEKYAGDFGTRWKDSLGTEGYLLIANNSQFDLIAYSETGLFYGLQTIAQLQKAGWDKGLQIADWPSFNHRQMYDDISRGPISTVAYVKEQIERLASVKINYLSFYIEHVVQPKSHPDFAPVNGKFTIEQIRELSAYAEKFHMQLVGSFQSFGHFEKILSLPQYQSMGETSTMISPLDEKARSFLRDVIGELCDAFSAPYFNINCDETFDLGKGRSKKYTDSVGVTRFYADHIKFLYDIVRSHNKQMMMWGDVALEHEEMLDILPRDIIYLTWEYGTQASFDKWIQPFAKRKLRFMACPGILNSYRMFPDMIMAYKNIETFAEAAKRAGAEGLVTTVWDDGGAYLFSCDWYGAYKAAENSWNVSSNSKISFDTRYATTAYGKNGIHYVNALDTFMKLRSVPLTFNLNDNVWHADIVPSKRRKLILNNANTDEVLRIAVNAKKELVKAVQVRNQHDIDALAIAIDQYILMMKARKTMPMVAAVYGEVQANNNLLQLQSAKTQLLQLRDGYDGLIKRFKPSWLRENQPYSLDIAVQPMTENSRSISAIIHALDSQVIKLKQHKPIADRQSIGLDITANPYTYFQYWLMCGPFATEANGKAPSFLYGGDGVEKIPKPGDLISYKNKTYRWQKYASQSGGITNVDDFYTRVSSPGIAYIFCTVTTDKPLKAGAFAALPAGAEIWCNGETLFIKGKNEQPASGETSFTLPLKAGTNNVLFKIPGGPMQWSFSFRLAPGFIVTNQKHKYFVNPEKQTHEAE
ncbi:MAG: family 20 glycosylhydrolase [Bacteroidota bacterium]